MEQITALALATALLTACQTAEPPTPENADLVGKITHVRDADTIEINGQAVRFNGVDLGAAAISAGYALDCRRYSGGRYADLELESTRETQRRASYC